MAAAKPEARVAQWKRDLVSDLTGKLEDYPVIGVLDVIDVPAGQFQQTRQLLVENDSEILGGRKLLLALAIEQASEKKPELKGLLEHLNGQVALIFSKMGPFKLWKFLDQNKSNAPAKPGTAAVKDIVIEKGDTDFPPGPIIGELQNVGINARIQAGKIVILNDCTILKEGEIITREKSEALAKFGIEPREIGFKLLAAFEEGIIFPGATLVVDEEKVRSQIIAARSDAFALSVEICYPTSDNIQLLLSKAGSQAFALALNSNVINSKTAPRILGKAKSEMLALVAVIASKDPNALDEELGGPAKPSEEKPAEEAEKSTEEAPAEEQKAEEKPAEKTPAEGEDRAEGKSAEEKSAEEKPAEEAPKEKSPEEAKPVEAPAEEPKAEEKPAEPPAEPEKPVEGKEEKEADTGEKEEKEQKSE